MYVTLSLQGFTRENVHDDLAKSLEKIVQIIQDLRQGEAAPATWHAVEGVRSWSWKDENGTVMFHESVDMRVTFRDFKRMSDWLADVSMTTGVSVNYISWDLTEVRKVEKQKDLRFKAIQDAREKAVQYAEAVGARITGVAQIADKGMHDGGLESLYSGGYDLSSAGIGVGVGAGSGARGINFEPEDVALTVSVDLQCLAE